MIFRDQNQSGFTLIEAILSVGLISVAVLGGMTAINQLNSRNSVDEATIGLAAARQQIISNLVGSAGWANSVIATENPGLACLKNQNSVNAADRDCTGMNESLTFFDTSGTLLYDFKSATIGVSPKGAICYEFSADSTSPNSACPNHVTVTATPICSAAVAGCQNPPIQLVHTMVRNGGPTGTLSASTMQFKTIRSTAYCPASTGTLALLSGFHVVADTFSFRSNLPDANLTTNRGEIDAILMPCRKQVIQFRVKIQDPATIVLPALADDPGNSQSLYIVSEDDSTDLLEFRSRYSAGAYRYQILENGVIVGNSPSWFTFTAASIFSFEVLNGLAKFCVDGRCVNFFEQKIVAPFRYEVRPASLAYAPNGVEIVGFATKDL